MDSLEALHKAAQHAADDYIDCPDGDREPELYRAWQEAKRVYEEAVKAKEAHG
jgi:hypothetical protein